MARNIPAFLGCNAEYSSAGLILFGVPFDGTTSFRPGARFGPGAIRQESVGVETYSPYIERDLTDCAIFDGGDIEVPAGSAERMIALTKERAGQIIRDGKRFVMLGGEHLASLGALQAAVMHYPDLHVIQLDAHADLRDVYQGEKLSHATVMRRVWELVGDGRIHQFGIRSGERSEFAFAQKHTRMQKFNLEGFQENVRELKNKPIYFTLDLDVLDPSVLPGTGTPEAGGIAFHELLAAVLQLHRLNVVACDVMELSPHYDHSGASTIAACKIVREILLQMGSYPSSALQ
ncbi:MAG TPA: agmatinase [Firmicutes bacterium]|nr:agmatinase [Bacillota bacterium]